MTVLQACGSPASTFLVFATIAASLLPEIAVCASLKSKSPPSLSPLALCWLSWTKERGKKHFVWLPAGCVLILMIR
ncbi:unnamed protein product [Coffea canephora]|uniref:Secreted protein n=1 Tax=Coffea canephora TaxID=49390 RepID=A0A068UUV2_COFCA|nr:unnamed protein product [Coffea canephora]